jgi:flavorubredoxin
MEFKNKKAASFGSYGWHAESTSTMDEALKNAGFELMAEGLKVNWVPDETGIQACIEYGKSIAEKLK